MKLELGKEYKRSTIHEAYGGQRQGGISTPTKFKYIFIFSNKSGKTYGYEDGWYADNTFYYTGQGQIGDMQFVRGNKEILNQRENGKEILLFSETKKSYYKYSAKLNFVDYNFIQTKDRNKQNRKAIQFILQSALSNTSPSVTPYATAQYKEKSIPPGSTERKGLVTSRVGQGIYRRKLMEKWGKKCAVTGINLEEILIASHIVPWRKASDFERWDPENGILLSPTYDALFDKNLISFDDSGRILAAAYVDTFAKQLGIDLTLTIEVTDQMKPYLARHRAELRD